MLVLSTQNWETHLSFPEDSGH